MKLQNIKSIYQLCKIKKLDSEVVEVFSVQRGGDISVASQYSQTLSNEKKLTDLLTEKLADKIFEELNEGLMIYKSYVLENDFKTATKKLFLFYGENIGLKDDFKIIIKNLNKNCEFLILNKMKYLNAKILYNEVSNISLFDKNKVFFINNATDKI